MDIKIKWFNKRYILKAFKPGWIIYKILDFIIKLFTVLFWIIFLFIIIPLIG